MQKGRQNMKRYEFILKDLDCAACANEIQEKLAKNPDNTSISTRVGSCPEMDVSRCKPTIGLSEYNFQYKVFWIYTLPRTVRVQNWISKIFDLETLL